MTPAEQCVRNRIAYIYSGYRIAEDEDDMELLEALTDKWVSRIDLMARIKHIAHEFGLKVSDFDIIDCKIILIFKEA